MSEEGGVANESVAPAVTPAVDEPMEIVDALEGTLKNALIADGLSRGLREATQALEQSKARLAIIASDCSEPAYTSLITALCLQHNVKLLKVKHGKKLGEFAGLRKLDKAGKARKVVACSCVVIRNYGADTKYLQTLLQYLESNDSIDN